MILASSTSRTLRTKVDRVILRTFSTHKTQPNVFISVSNDPYFNLSYEDWLFRQTDPSLPILFMYRNKESVIIGRNQNPWKEINQTALRQSNIEFVRRRSGGGTVYHDLGNTNYSVMIPRETFDRSTNAELVAAALNSPDIGIPASVNERHDIVVEGKKICTPFPAYSVPNLFALDTFQALRTKSLANGRTTTTSLHTKGVASVRSPVANLVSFSSNITHDTFIYAVARAFREKYHQQETSNDAVVHVEHGNEIVEKGADELRSWDWRFGQTPEFTHDLSKTFPWGQVKVHIASRKGLITDCTVSGIDLATNDLVGLRYGTLDGAEDILTKTFTGQPNHLQNVLTWLRLEM